MLYGFKIAMRYLTANKTQTGLLIAGVAVGGIFELGVDALDSRRQIRVVDGKTL
ncbi:hypothetical protein [Devosia sp.]|uniref:hypothetical protein n=1 Tax=Devosia sp. TaxID=1871048 RepID=UPI002AFE6ED5|nr:hypothetical protein [Devosia sp.]